MNLKILSYIPLCIVLCGCSGTFGSTVCDDLPLGEPDIVVQTDNNDASLKTAVSGKSQGYDPDDGSGFDNGNTIKAGAETRDGRTLKQDNGKENSVSEDNISIDIFVYICGQVANPGVYKAKSNSRIYQIIEMAGGLTDEADIRCVNQASLCSDGEMIYVPAADEVKSSDVCSTAGFISGSAKGSEGSEGSGDGRININTADAAKLCEISGIGESRAQDIILFRENNGNFASTEDIMKVPGIKQGMYEKIKDRITV
ncbi:MAG: ComEA family DNA-binding protein [Lachnospiraceae bacterium]|nr:ComEA family DNA-binding protein [Lachnospiraceae bacterium]